MWRHNIFDYVANQAFLIYLQTTEMIVKKLGSGKRNDAQPADSDEAESEASDKDKSSGWWVQFRERITFVSGIKTVSFVFEMYALSVCVRECNIE